MGVEQFDSLIAVGDGEQLDAYVSGLTTGETARAVSLLEDDDQARLLTLMSSEEAADLVEQIPDVQAVPLIEQLEPQTAAAILRELPSDERADLLGAIQPENAEAILAEMSPPESRAARLLTQYPNDVAGGLMVSEFLAFPASITAGHVIDDLEQKADEYRDYTVQYVYVTTRADELAGVLRLRDLLLAHRDQPIENLMIREPLSITDFATVDELWDFFHRHHLLGAPVVTAAGRLIGVVHRGAVEAARQARSESNYLKSQGIVGGEEFRTMPILLRSRRRLAWLSVNVVLNVIAASVIAFYQETLAAAIALAVFLPIISDMSGCSGSQAVAVSMRELTAGLLRPTEMLYVLVKEACVGCINGVVLGALIASVAWLWKGNPFLGLVVGAAMALNTLIAVSIGGTVPLLLKRMNVDPALASGPILTTITDMCGFFLVLSFASATLPYLN
jgi:magnesium transporter